MFGAGYEALKRSNGSLKDAFKDVTIQYQMPQVPKLVSAVSIAVRLLVVGPRSTDAERSSAQQIQASREPGGLLQPATIARLETVQAVTTISSAL
jgi:hypothetical protein